MDDTFWTVLLLAMALPPGGLQLDHLTTIINVHWGEGLAVEFAKGST